MPEEKIYFKTSEGTLGIPSSQVEAFKKDVPDAVEVQLFTAKNEFGKTDTLGIPKEQVDDFLKDVPDAKPLSLGKPSAEPSKSISGKSPSGGGEFGFNQTVGAKQPKPIAQPSKPSKASTEFGINKTIKAEEERVPRPSDYAPKQQVVAPFAGLKQSAETLPKREKVGEERYGEMLSSLRNDQSKAYPSYQALNKTVNEQATFLNQQKPLLDAMIEQANILDADQQEIVNRHKNEVAKFNALTKEVEEEAKTLQQRIDDVNVPIETRQQILDTFKQKVNFIDGKKSELEEGDNIVNQIYKDASLKNAPVKQKIDEYNTVLGKHKQDIEELGKLEQVVNQNQRAINVLNKAYTRKGGQFEKEQQLLKEQVFDKRPLTEKVVSWKNETQASLYNTVVPSLVKSLGAAYKLAAIMTPLKGDMNALNDIVGDKILKFGDEIEVSREDINKMTGFENPYAEKALYDEINPFNLSKGIANVIGSVGMTLAGGGALGRTALTVASKKLLQRTGGQAAAFAQIYGNSYEDGIKAGLKNEQALMYASAIALPSAVLEQFGVSKLFDLAATKGGKKILQEAILSELKKNGGKMTAKEIFDFTSKKVVQLLASGAVEGSVEVSQTGAEFLAKLGTEAITDADFEGNLTMNDFKRQAYDSFVLGFGAGGASSLAIQTSPQAINTVAAEALKSPEKMQDFKDNLELLRINGDITPEGFNAANTALNKAIDVSKTVPLTITNVDDRAKAIDLIQKRDELTAQLEGVDPDLAAPIQEELKTVKGELQDLAKGVKPIISEAQGAEFDKQKEQAVAEQKAKEVKLKEEVRKQRDAELEQIQAIRADLGTDAELIDDLPEAVDNVIDRIDLSAPIDNVAINESIAALDKKFSDLEAYKNNPNRTHTIAQIEAMQDIFSQTKSEIQAYQEKQSENGIQAERTTETKTREPQTTTAESAPSQQEVTTQTTENAIQEQGAGRQISRPGEAGQNIPEGGQGVRPSEQGKETAQQGKEKVNPALKDVESTAKALDKVSNPNFKNTIEEKLSKFDKQIEQKKFPSALEVAEHVLPRSIFNKYKALYELAARNNITVSSERLPSGMAASWAYGNIQINKDVAKYYLGSYEEFAETINHEIIHGLISRGVRDNYGLSNDLQGIMEIIVDAFSSASSEVKDIISYIQDTRNEFTEQDIQGATEQELNSNKLREVGSLEELITYAFTNSEFAKFLDSLPASKNIEAKGNSIFQQLKNIIRDFISSVTKNPTALDEINSILDKYFDTTWNETQISDRNKTYEWGLRFSANKNIFDKYDNDNKKISEAYHAAKKDDSNPELVKAVEELLTPNITTNESKNQSGSKENAAKNENGIQEGGTNGNENVSENVQGKGKKGRAEVNVQNEGQLQEVTTTPSADLAQQGEAATEGAKTETDKANETKTQENIPAATETDKGGEQSVVQEGLTEPTDKEIQVAAERLGIPLEPVTETPKTNGKVEPLTDAQLKLKEAKEKLSGTIDDVKKKFKDLYTSNVGIIFDPKVEAKKRFDFHMALRDLAVDAIRLGIVNIQQFSNVAGRQIDGALKLAWSEAQSLLSGAPTVINTVDDMENRLVQIQASALQREKDENDKLNKTFKGKIIDAYFAAYDSIFGNHLPAKRLIDKATNNAIDNVPNYNSGANTISQARERGKLVDAARRVLRLQNLIPGAKSYAKSLYDEKGAPIFRGLNAAKKEMLNNIIEMRTIISIDKRFAEKKEADLLRLNTELASATDPKEIARINKEIKAVEDRPNIRHTSAENGETTSIYTALAYLASLQSKTDPEAQKTFEMLNDRATDYFAFMNELLLAKKNAGIISPELYNALINNEYSKRQFLEYVLSDGSGGSYRMGNKSYSLDGIKKIELGSEGAMVQNKEWLMKANIMSTARSIYSNNARVGLLDFVRLDPNNGLFREQKPSGVNNEGRPVFSESEVKKGEGQIFGREMEYIPTVDFTLDGVDYKKGIPISQEVYSDILNSPNGALLTTQIEAVGGKYFSIIAPIKFIETFEYPQTWLDPRAKKVLRFASLVGITSISAVTINPKFFLGNLPKDWLNALMHSEAYRGGILPVKALKLGKDILSVSKDAATKGKLYRELMTYGGGFNTLSQEASPFEADFLNENKGLVKGAQKIYDGLSYLGSTSEIMTRLAIYSRTEKNLINKFIKENGGRQPNELQRVEFKRMAADAARSIMDYSKKGNVSDIAGTLYPFFNAGIRAVEGAKKSWVDDPTGTALTYGQIAMLTAGLILYNLRPENEDDYEKIDEKIKLNNFIIILPYSKTIDGKKERAYIKIPKTQSAQLLSNATEQAIRSQMGKKFNQDILFEAARNTAAIPELSPYSIPTVAAYGSLIHGYDHYHKRNVWNDRTPRSEGLKYVPTGRNKTPKSIVDLGEKVDVAPVNIELALKQIALSKDNIYFRAIDGGYRQIVADMTPEEKLIYDENVLEGIGNSFGSKFLDYTYDKPADKKEIDKAVRLENDVKVKLDNRLKVITQLITDGKKTPAESEMAVRNLVDSAPNNLKYDIYKKYSDYLKNIKFIVTSNINVGGINFKKGALIDRSVYNKILALPNGKSLVNQIEINDDAAFLEGLKYIDAPNVKALQFVNEFLNKETEEEKNDFIRTAIEMKILPEEGLGFQIKGKVIDTGKGQVIPKYSSSKFEQEVSRLLREEKEKENQLNKQ